MKNSVIMLLLGFVVLYGALAYAEDAPVNTTETGAANTNSDNGADPQSSMGAQASPTADESVKDQNTDEGVPTPPVADNSPKDEKPANNTY